MWSSVEQIVHGCPEWMQQFVVRSGTGQEEAGVERDLQQFPEEMRHEISLMHNLTKELIRVTSDSKESTERVDQSKEVLSKCVVFLESKKIRLSQMAKMQHETDPLIEKMTQIIDRSSLAARSNIRTGDAGLPQAQKTDERMAPEEIALMKADIIRAMQEETAENSGMKNAFPALWDVILLLLHNKIPYRDGVVDGSLALRKGGVLWEGMKLAYRLGATGAMRHFELSSAAQGLFQLTDGTVPALIDRFVPKEGYCVTCTPGGYEYSEGVTTDFANMRLGGGVFDRGSLVEETMAMEIISFADFLARHIEKNAQGDVSGSKSTVLTRVPLEGRTNLDEAELFLQGNPRPHLLVGGKRVQTFDRTVGFMNFGNVPESALFRGMIRIVPPQEVNLLALAAPRLPARDEKLQYSEGALQDLLVGILAKYKLLEEAGLLKSVDNSGKWGCGYFNNSIRAVYMIQRMVAAQYGARQTLHMYTDAEQKLCEEDWAALEKDLIGRPFKECLSIMSQYFAAHPDPDWMKPKPPVTVPSTAPQPPTKV